MRRTIAFIITAVLALSLLSGCAKKDETAATQTAGGQTAGTQAQTEQSAQEESIDQKIAKLKPEDYGTVKLGEYKNIPVTVQKAQEIDDAYVNQYINDIAASYAEEKSVDRESMLGDTVNIDFAGYHDGVAFDGGTAAGYNLKLGSGTFIEGFEEGLVHKKKGDKVSLNLKFPDPYPNNTDLSGEDVVFEVTINDITETVIPEINDAWTKKVSGDASMTVDALKAQIKDYLVFEAEENVKSAAVTEVLTAITQNSTFDFNEETRDLVYQSQYNVFISNIQNQFGVDLDRYLELTGVSIESFEEDVHSRADEAIRQTMVINAIYDTEKMESTEEDVIGVENSYGMDIETLKEYYGDNAVEQLVRNLKVVNFLYDSADKTFEE